MTVIPAQAGIQKVILDRVNVLDPGLRRGDGTTVFGLQWIVPTLRPP
jgi:hypothetical protein